MVQFTSTHTDAATTVVYPDAEGPDFRTLSEDLFWCLRALVAELDDDVFDKPAECCRGALKRYMDAVGID